MDVTIGYLPPGGRIKEFTVPIQDYKVIVDKTTLLIVDIGTFDDKELPKDNDFIDVYQVQFIANCRLSIGDNVVIAFYLSSEPGVGLLPYVINGLPDHHFQTTGRNVKKLIDYQSYCEVCKQTNETMMSLADYIIEMKNEVVGTNTFLVVGDKKYNYDGQKVAWKELANVT